MVVDLRACAFVDSRGIGALIEAALKLQEEDRKLILRGAHARVLRTLQIAGLTDSDLLELEQER